MFQPIWAYFESQFCSSTTWHPCQLCIIFRRGKYIFCVIQVIRKVEMPYGFSLETFLPVATYALGKIL